MFVIVIIIDVLVILFNFVGNIVCIMLILKFVEYS